MIGHFLLTLTPLEEGRVLTTVLAPGQTPELYAGHFAGSFFHDDGSRCLVGAVYGARVYLEPWTPTRLIAWASLDYSGLSHSVTWRFDGLCHRFGVARIGRVIRERILANQVRRSGQALRVTVDPRRPSDVVSIDHFCALATRLAEELRDEMESG